MRQTLLGTVACALGLVLTGPAAATAADLTVFAAASLKTALDAAAAGFTAETGLDVATAYAGSSVLARQITQGAPADVFISASPDWMDVLDAEGLVVPGSRTDLLGNRLVLIAPNPDAAPDAPQAEITPDLNLAALLGDGHLAMAFVEAVPAGIYGKAALEALGLWESVAPRVVETDNVRAALALVALGEAPFGIVYATDAAAEDAVTIAGTFPESSHPPIIYPAAATTTGRTEDATAFLAHLQGPEARATFEAAGFLPLTPPSP